MFNMYLIHITRPRDTRQTMAKAIIALHALNGGKAVMNCQDTCLRYYW